MSDIPRDALSPGMRWWGVGETLHLWSCNILQHQMGGGRLGSDTKTKIPSQEMLQVNVIPVKNTFTLNTTFHGILSLKVTTSAAAISKPFIKSPCASHYIRIVKKDMLLLVKPWFIYVFGCHFTLSVQLISNDHCFSQLNRHIICNIYPDVYFFLIIYALFCIGNKPL